VGFKGIVEEETGLKAPRGLKGNDKQSIKTAHAEAWEQIIKGTQVMSVLAFTYTLGKGPYGAHLTFRVLRAATP
jgi:hypothetical protein